MKTLPYGPQTNFSIFEDTMAEMTWQEVEAAARRGAAVLLPVGIVEAHGPHMDLTPDFYISALYCRYLRQELDILGCEAIIAPTVYWGVGEAMAKYPGTFSVRPETMRRLLCDVLDSLARWGFRDVFIFNAHGNRVHMDIIREAANVCSRDNFRVYPLFDLEKIVNILQRTLIKNLSSGYYSRKYFTMKMCSDKTILLQIFIYTNLLQVIIL